MRSLFILTSTIILFSLFTGSYYSAVAYDPEKGVEWGDVVNISFVRHVYRDNVFVPSLTLEYTADSPFRIVIDDDMFNYNLVSELVGMKIGETKSITWEVTEANGTVFRYEYLNTTIIEILKDATPDKAVVAGRIFLTFLEVTAAIGAAIGVFYLLRFLRRRFLIGVKRCSQCKKPADVKCVKCGILLCHNCSKKGCPNCGSKKFIRIKK